jgi:molybdenum cofactor guanylyltransferase
MNNKTNLLGVVLCGGESKRMGSDKGLLHLHGATWAEHIAGKLRAHGLPVVVSINSLQQAAYSKVFLSEELIVDELPMHGPLNGLLTVHHKFEQKDILLLACDLIEMDDSTLSQLIEAYEKNDAEYFAFEQDNFFQPLSAIYTSKALSSLSQRLKSGSLANYSFQHILNNSNTFRLHAASQKAFNNYNASQILPSQNS